MSEIDDELYEMVNLAPRLTGLPMTVWAGPRGNGQHNVSVKVVKVVQTHDRHMDITNTAVVGVRPAPRLVKGHLSVQDMQAVSDWVRLNEGALVDYWEFRIDTGEFLQRLQPLAPPILP